MKYIKFKRLNFSIIVKYFNNLRFYFIKFFSFKTQINEVTKKIYRYFNFSKYKIQTLSSYNFLRFYKNINLKRYKSTQLYFLYFIFFVTFSYVSIPFFYNYDKSTIEKRICENTKKIECLIGGNIRYNFFPTPRIKINDLEVKILLGKKKKTLVKVEKASIKLSIFDLLNKKKQKFKKIEFNNFEINFDLSSYKSYFDIFKKYTNFIPFSLEGGKIIFFDSGNYIASIDEVDFKLNHEKNFKKNRIKGKFLDDNIYIDTKTKKQEGKISSDIIIKISKLNLLLKANTYYQENNKDTIKGNFLLKKNKNRITSVFSYKDNTLNLIKSKLSNNIMEGKAEGKIEFSPYFNFNIDVSLNNLNFTKLYNLFLFLDEETKKNVFNINRKINGILSLSSDKVYSNNDLVRSFESRLRFNNSDIIIEQFILNLGKLGASDIIGKISRSKKTNNFKFESNIFVDNQKKFLNKFGIYSRKNISSSMFVAGNFDFDDLRMHFYEIFYDEKIKDQDINYIEKEFNNLMLEDGYKTLFDFSQFKEFIKSITSDED